MKLRSIGIIFLTILIFSFCGNQSAKKRQDNTGVKVEFVNHEADKRIDVMIDGKLLTSYCWPENVYKPILFPVYTSAGTEITRGFPLKPRKGERNDHIHQAGIWLNYGNVNGYDFWGNGSRGVKEPNGGEIKHLAIEKSTGGTGEGVLITKESWVDPRGKELLAEKTEYHFIAKGSLRIIDRVTTLTAGDTTIFMKDTKEGIFGIRVARELEVPSNEALILIDSTGNPASKKVTTNVGVTGNYRSSEGITGEAVWGTRAKWMVLDGIIGEEKISLAICDHPGNQSYPTFWHARGYGLFAANPLGWNDFTKGKEVLNFTIPAGKTVTFRYRVIINSGVHLTDIEINNLAQDFSGRY